MSGRGRLLFVKYIVVLHSSTSSSSSNDVSFYYYSCYASGQCIREVSRRHSCTYHHHTSSLSCAAGLVSSKFHRFCLKLVSWPSDMTHANVVVIVPRVQAILVDTQQNQYLYADIQRNLCHITHTGRFKVRPLKFNQCLFSNPINLKFVFWTISSCFNCFSTLWVSGCIILQLFNNYSCYYLLDQ